jgi:ubiquinone/menaquinone biosynthesis C-methylase UbiE
MTDGIVEAFTELAPRYEATMDWELRVMWRLRYREFVHRLVRVAQIAEGERILDVATGTAVIPSSIAAFRDGRTQIVGLDLTPAMLQQGARTLRQAPYTSRIDLLCASAMNVSLADGTFDVAICGLAMHHLDVTQTLAEIKRVLTKRGRLVMGMVGVPPSWRTRWGHWLAEHAIRTFYALTHSGARAEAEVAALYNLHTLPEWRDILRASGFNVIEISEIPSRFRWGPSALVVKAC